MRISSRRNSRCLTTKIRDSQYLIFALCSLIILWMVCFFILVGKLYEGKDTSLRKKITNHDRIEALEVEEEKAISKRTKFRSHEEIMPSRILSRSTNVTVTADVRGNLGPVNVIIQDPPGKDWIKDRWQAASNMHGKAIPGSHWIQLNFGCEVIVDKIVLDWEAAYSDHYIVKGSLESIDNNDIGWTLFDGADTSQRDLRTVEESGQSPGVKSKTPLHVVHTIHPIEKGKPLRYMKLIILDSAMGWGVSLWQADVYGLYKSQVMA